MRKKKAKSKKSELAREVVKYADQLFNGLCVSIDPSSGSASSLPGYSVWKAGVLQDCGVVKIPPGTRALHQRLFLLHETLKFSLPKPDILCVEKISQGLGVGGNVWATKASASLLKSVGCILSVWDCPVLEISPMTWRSLIDADRYQKSDTQDAVVLYCAARIICERELGREETPIVYI